jgi:hypothetical protein
MKNKLDELHDGVTKELLARVESGNATSAELSVAVKFLKDNGASNDIVTAESPMASLLTALPFEEASH